MDASQDNYHLTATSAAVNTSVEAGIRDDFDGVTRPQGSIPDIGAFESPYSLPELSIGDGSLVEGNSGMVTLTLPITMSFSRVITVIVAYTITGGAQAQG